MGQLGGQPLRRFATLTLVVALHAAIIVMLLRSSPLGGATAARPAVEVLLLPAVPPPKVRVRIEPPKRSNFLAGVTLATPQLESEASFTARAQASSSNAAGPGVDWAAEARRALQAFEIRKHQPQRNQSISRAPGEDDWWPRAKHQVGDRFKTPEGDWIVWISEACFQATSAGVSSGRALAEPARIVCLNPEAAAAQGSRAP